MQITAIKLWAIGKGRVNLRLEGEEFVISCTQRGIAEREERIPIDGPHPDYNKVAKRALKFATGKVPTNTQVLKLRNLMDLIGTGL